MKNSGWGFKYLRSKFQESGDFEEDKKKIIIQRESVKPRETSSVLCEPQSESDYELIFVSLY